MEKSTQSLSERISRRRDELALTQQGLADLLDVHIRSVQNWEAGKVEPQAQALHKLAATLQVPIAYFYGSELQETAPGFGSETVVRFTTKSPLAAQCLNHLHDYLNTCEDDAAHLGWTLVELRQHFPLDKWKRQAATEPMIPGVSSDVAAALRAGAETAAAAVAPPAPPKRLPSSPTGAPSGGKRKP